jgi:hypothetical protein
MIITDKAQIKAASLKESDKLRLTTSDELECYELIESDLKLPADATFTRSSVAYLSDGTQVAVNQPRFEQGRFGKAIMVEEGTTNLAINPLFENPLSEWQGPQSMSYSTRITDTPFGERPVLVMNGGASDYTYIHANYNFAPLPGSDAPVTVSLWMRNLGSDEGVPKFYLGAGYLSTDKILKADGNWYQISRTFQPEEYTQNGRFHFYKGVMGEVEVCAIQVEYRKPYATSFIDGTRAAEKFTLPNVLNPRKGTIEVKHFLNYVGGDQYLLANNVAFNQPGHFRVHIGSNYHIAVLLPDGTTKQKTFSSSYVKLKQWQTWVVVYDADLSIFDLFIDGQRVTDGNPVDISTLNLDTTLHLSGHLGNMSHGVSGLRDDLRISSRARTDAEILAAHQSGQPLLADEWTTYKLDFDDKVRITTQGQIICNELIEI